MTMYFFHPIKQCAQQIYPTAFPLLPQSSSSYREGYLFGIPSDQTHVTGFLGAPSCWGLLLTTISLGPKRPTAIATFAEKIAIACEDAVNIYNAVTFALEQSLRIPQSFTKIQGSLNASILYSTHSRSVALWDIQTGGLIDTFHTRRPINDAVASQMDRHIACCLSDSSVAYRDGCTKKEGSFRSPDFRPVVTICWLSRAELAIATTDTIHIMNIDTRIALRVEANLTSLWGMVVLSSDELIVGTSGQGAAGESELSSLSRTAHGQERNWSREPFFSKERRQPTFRGQLTSPMLVGENIVCVTPPNGVGAFDTKGHGWTKPPLLEKAKSLAVSLRKDLVVRTEDSVQIFSPDVLERKANRKDEGLSHVYPLGNKHAVCLRIDRHLTILDLETLRSLRPGVDTSLLDCESCGRGLVAEFGVSMVVQAWGSLASLPRRTGGAEGDALLGGSSPMGTRIAALYGLPGRELRVKEAADGKILAKLPLEDDSSEGKGVVYDLTFDSETRFYLKVDGSGYHLKIPYDIITSPSGRYPCTITRGEPVPLSAPRKTSPYTLDANCEWVLDTGSRKICWIPPDIMQRGSGGHFWVGASLVMLGSDSVVRKLTFKDPDC